MLLLFTPSLIKAQTLTITLTHTNVTCFGARDGSITATVTGGSPPYQYLWTNERTTQTISALSGGFYEVAVTDANNDELKENITLTEPERLVTTIATPIYSNGFNVTCHFCFDGRVNTSVSGGVAPYSYFYSDGAVTPNRTDMRAGNFQLLITDAHGCSNQHEFGLSAPDQEYWLQGGNAGTTPGSQFIGTSDNKDLVFKTNASERLRLSATGDLKINSLSGTGSFSLNVDASGKLVKGYQVQSLSVPWMSRGNDNIQNSADWIGTLNNADFIIKTDANGSGGERMRILSGGGVAIGTTTLPPGNIFGVTGNSYFNGTVGVNTSYVPNDYKLAVDGKIICNELKVKAKANWPFPDYVFAKDYKLKSLTEIKAYINQNKHLPDMPSADEIQNNDGYEIGAMQYKLTEKVEELFLHVIRLEERNNLLSKENEQLRKDVNQLKAQH